MKKLLLLLCVLFAGLGLTACNTTGKGLSTEGVLVVGMECAYNPFNWTEGVSNEYTVAIDNQPGSYVDGYDVQIAKMIADELDVELKIKALEWGGLISALNAGEIDMIIAGMSNTAERRQSIDFTNGYYTSEEVLLVMATGEYADCTKLSQFAGAVVAGQQGTLYADFAEQASKNHGTIFDATKNLATVADILNEMNSGLVDAQVVELPVAQGIVAADSSYKIVRLDADSTFVTNPEDVEVCIGIRKEFTLKDRVNEILAGISTETRNQLMAEAVNRAGQSE